MALDDQGARGARTTLPPLLAVTMLFVAARSASASQSAADADGVPAGRLMRRADGGASAAVSRDGSMERSPNMVEGHPVALALAAIDEAGGASLENADVGAGKDRVGDAMREVRRRHEEKAAKSAQIVAAAKQMLAESAEERLRLGGDAARRHVDVAPHRDTGAALSEDPADAPEPPPGDFSAQGSAGGAWKAEPPASGDASGDVPSPQGQRPSSPSYGSQAAVTTPEASLGGAADSVARIAQDPDPTKARRQLPAAVVEAGSKTVGADAAEDTMDAVEVAEVGKASPEDIAQAERETTSAINAINRQAEVDAVPSGGDIGGSAQDATQVAQNPPNKKIDADLEQPAVDPRFSRDFPRAGDDLRDPTTPAPAMRMDSTGGNEGQAIVKTLDFLILRNPGDDLGLEVETVERPHSDLALVVRATSLDFAVKHPHVRIAKGDEIVEVNGETSANRMRTELQTNLHLDIKVIPADQEPESNVPVAGDTDGQYGNQTTLPFTWTITTTMKPHPEVLGSFKDDDPRGGLQEGGSECAGGTCFCKPGMLIRYLKTNFRLGCIGSGDQVHSYYTGASDAGDINEMGYRFPAVNFSKDTHEVAMAPSCNEPMAACQHPPEKCDFSVNGEAGVYCCSAVRRMCTYRCNGMEKFVCNSPSPTQAQRMDGLGGLDPCTGAEKSCFIFPTPGGRHGSPKNWRSLHDSWRHGVQSTN